MLEALPTALFMVGTLVMCALVTFMGAYWIMSGVIERKLSSSEAVLLTMGLLVFQSAAVALAVRGGAGILLLALVVFGVGALLRSLSAKAQARIKDDLDQSDIAKCQRTLELDPKNVGAHSLLGEIYRRMGKLEEALSEYEAALALNPSLIEERFRAERLKGELDRRGRKVMLCPGCGAERPAPNPPRSKKRIPPICPECGRWYSTVETWAHALRAMPQRRRVFIFTAGVAALSLLMGLATLAPGKARVGLIIAILLSPLVIMLMSIILQRRAEQKL